MKVPMNSAKNSRITCLSKNLAIACDDLSMSLAARTAWMELLLEEWVDDAVDSAAMIITGQSQSGNVVVGDNK